MTDYPITPPPELRQLWAQQAQRMSPRDPVEWMQHVSEKAAQWGADRELEACCEWLASKVMSERKYPELRADRRPKPPSLKEQSLKHLEVMERDGHYLPEILQDLRRAVEQLDG
jgi:hypothetical protein